MGLGAARNSVTGPVVRSVARGRKTLDNARSQPDLRADESGYALAAIDRWEFYQTAGGTSAQKALHLSGLGRSVACETMLGDDGKSAKLHSVLEAAGVGVFAPGSPGDVGLHLNLMTRAGERVSGDFAVPARITPDVA